MVTPVAHTQELHRICKMSSKSQRCLQHWNMPDPSITASIARMDISLRLITEETVKKNIKK
jgi:hypothetical protein